MAEHAQAGTSAADTALAPLAARYRERRLGERLLRLARQNPHGFIGLLAVAAVLAVAILAPAIAPTDPTAQGAGRLLPPSAAHPMGTDELGRDVFSRIVYGSRISLRVALVSVGLAVLLGVTLGVLAGFYGGTFDTLVMRLVDILLAFPGLVLAIVITGLLGPDLTNAMIAIGIIYAPQFARVARGAVLAVMAEPYVEAARVIGASHARIILQYALPNAMAPLIVLATLSLSTAILAEASLSFLGLGAQPPEPSWGTMLKTGRRYMEIAPWVVVFPGLAIMFVVQGFNFFGDGLRDALDPRLRQ